MTHHYLGSCETFPDGVLVLDTIVDTLLMLMGVILSLLQYSWFLNLNVNTGPRKPGMWAIV